MPWVGFKVMPSGYTATNPWSLNNTTNEGEPEVPPSSTTSAKGLATGLYTFWQVWYHMAHIRVRWTAQPTVQ